MGLSHCDQALSALTLGLCWGPAAGRADLHGPGCPSTNPLYRMGILSNEGSSLLCHNCSVHLNEECLSEHSSSSDLSLQSGSFQWALPCDRARHELCLLLPTSQLGLGVDPLRLCRPLCPEQHSPESSQIPSDLPGNVTGHVAPVPGCQVCSVAGLIMQHGTHIPSGNI